MSQAVVPVNNQDRSMIPARPIGTVEEAVAVFDRLSNQVNLVSPFARLDYIPPMHKISLRVVRIDTDTKGKDVYHNPLFCDSDEVALTRIGLLKVWQAMGGSILESKRTDDRSDPRYCEWTIIGQIKLMDGTVQTYQTTKDVDLREGSDQIVKMKPGQLAGAREQIVTLAESKTFNRLIRAAGAIPQKFKRTQLEKPIVVPALVPDLDTSDPVVRQMVAAKALGLEGALYPPQALALPPATPTAPEVATGDVTVLVDDGEGDDWGDFPAPVICLLPVPEEKLQSMDENHRKWCLRLNEFASKIHARYGENAPSLINQIIGTVDLGQANRQEAEQIVASLRQITEGGAK